MSKFLVDYTLPYEHVVRVGIEAHSAEEAKAKASAAMDDGTLWDDTPEQPLLMDEWEEACNGTVLEFHAAQVEAWPEPGHCVQAIRRRSASQLLLEEMHALLEDLNNRWDKEDQSDNPELGNRLDAMAGTTLESLVSARMKGAQ